MQGGFFERLIQSVKRCLRKCLGKSLLNYEELLTFLAEIERILNNRPLTFINDDVNEEILTPSSLIYGKTVNIEFVDDKGDRNDDAIIRHKYIVDLFNHFWNRWLNEYVVNLRETHKHCIQSSKNVFFRERYRID